MDEPASFWDDRYREGNTPWDFGGVPPEFLNWLHRTPRPGKVLVPGCGSGYELRALAETGADPTGLDLSTEAVKRARATLGERNGRVLAGDFFTHPFSHGEFDAVYERTFLCALDPLLRTDYARRMAQLLKPGGLLAGFFLFGHEPEPPPHPLAAGGDHELFDLYFEKIESVPTRHTLPIFAGFEERWQVWRKRT